MTRFFNRKIIGKTLKPVIEQFLPVMSKNDVGHFAFGCQEPLSVDTATASRYIDRYNRILVLGTSRSTSRRGPPPIPLHGVRDQSGGSAFPLCSPRPGVVEKNTSHLHPERVVEKEKYSCRRRTALAGRYRGIVIE